MGFAFRTASAKSMASTTTGGSSDIQCLSCGHQDTLTTCTMMQASKLSLTTLFLFFYLIGQAKTGISSLELRRNLGVKCETHWLLHNKILRAMADREDG